MGYRTRSEGRVAVTGGSIWYKTVGYGPKLPLVVVHGGPGYPHDYLESLEALSDERMVIFYDQLGCGRSDRPDDETLWTVERYVLELAALCEHLDLKRYHLFGHSWGTMLAVDFALTWPEGLQSLILASPCIDIPRWIDDAKALRSTLPEEVQKALAEGEASGDVHSADYLAATEQYYRNFVCRLNPKPEPVQRSDLGAGVEVYTHMWGVNEFNMTGTLADFDRSDRLGDISLPVLYTCGSYDEARPEACRTYDAATPRSVLYVFEKSSHLPHWEERDEYIDVVRDFLDSVEEGAEISRVLRDQAQQSKPAIFFCLLAVAFALTILGRVFIK